MCLFYLFRDIAENKKLYVIQKDNGKFGIGKERMEFNSLDNLITYYWDKDNSKRTGYPLIFAVPFKEMLDIRYNYTFIFMASESYQMDIFIPVKLHLSKLHSC